ncbi:MAG: 3-deoxy-manno-octulosonate cytidylyltransferase [Lewinellaceae bacterium]|nr:3-deoxy-manno-octulosonate cytidylyltransferase [Saprospiraceae bacterium]MCB9311596.1 3-deoxy-manno-octulosonate cytidylyltransferase [Lewinellaceae bacterium]
MDSQTPTTCLGIIPARWASSRFPGKPLADLNGRPMVLHVWDKCRQAGLDRIVIATDDERIAACCQEAGAEVQLTDPDLPSGTDRCAVVARDATEDLVINIQGDEPFISPDAIRQLVALLKDQPICPIATLARKEVDPEVLSSPNVVKVVCNNLGEAMYFSRAWIPYQRDRERDQWPLHATYLTHIGLYGFRRDILMELSALPVGILERTEQLEQLRWLSEGYRISVGVTDYQSMGIDTPEDLVRARLWSL